MVTDRKKQTPTYTIKGPKFNGALSLQGAEEPLMAHPPSTGSKFSWNFLVNQSIAVILSSVLLLSVVILGLITRLITYIPVSYTHL